LVVGNRRIGNSASTNSCLTVSTGKKFAISSPIYG
jgi:hypothetical protein